MSTRTETDSLGPVEVPADALWGAQTQRSLAHFDIRAGKDTFPRVFLRAYGLVKQACAEANAALEVLDAETAGLISRAAEEVIEGALDDHFPLVVWQTGSGTQTNMNLNEVIANRANQLAGAELGAKAPVHPNDHVNRGQSTNDTFPTAMHVAAALAVHEALLPTLGDLVDTLELHASTTRDLVKIGRTHLMDATPLRFGDEISGWAAQLVQARHALEAALWPVYKLAVGGTAVGTGLNAAEGFDVEVCQRLADKTALPFEPAHNKFSQLAAHDALVGLSGALNQLACAYMKIANDVRWLASGPRCGIGELEIPANEPGSSIMPGKVNPTQSEQATQVCCQVMGLHMAVTVAGSQGNFELNVFKPVIAHNVLTAAELLTDSLRAFDAHCARGMRPNRARATELVERSLMLVTALAPEIGYDLAAKIAKKAHEEGTTLREAALALDALPEDELDALLDPAKMV